MASSIVKPIQPDSNSEQGHNRFVIKRHLQAVRAYQKVAAQTDIVSRHEGTSAQDYIDVYDVNVAGVRLVLTHEEYAPLLKRAYDLARHEVMISFRDLGIR